MKIFRRLMGLCFIILCLSPVFALKNPTIAPQEKTPHRKSAKKPIGKNKSQKFLTLVLEEKVVDDLFEKLNISDSDINEVAKKFLSFIKDETIVTYKSAEIFLNKIVSNLNAIQKKFYNSKPKDDAEVYCDREDISDERTLEFDNNPITWKPYPQPDIDHIIQLIVNFINKHNYFLNYFDEKFVQETSFVQKTSYYLEKECGKKLRAKEKEEKMNQM